MFSCKILNIIVIFGIISPIFCQFLDLGKAIKSGGEQAISAVATPVEQAVVATTLKNCDIYKKLFGVTYELIDEPDTSKLTLDLWSGSKKDVFNITTADHELLDFPKFDVRKKTVFFLHGFLSTSESDAALVVTKSFITKGGYNVLALDSSSLIKYFYLRASTLINFIGDELGIVIAGLVKGGLDPKSIHIIGHSLGSHIAGAAGKKFQELTGKKIARITGLDPAGPCFFRETPKLRLIDADADFVDTIHSDCGVLGISEPLGHVDFYPNNGEAQPGCALPPCSHSRSWELFNETILNPEAFVAYKCPGWDTFKSNGCRHNDKSFIGLNVNFNKRGVYYLKTKGSFPFGTEYKQESTTKSGLFKLF